MGGEGLGSAGGRGRCWLATHTDCRQLSSVHWLGISPAGTAGRQSAVVWRIAAAPRQPAGPTCRPNLSSARSGDRRVSRSASAPCVLALRQAPLSSRVRRPSRPDRGATSGSSSSSPSSCKAARAAQPPWRPPWMPLPWALALLASLLALLYFSRCSSRARSASAWGGGARGRGDYWH